MRILSWIFQTTLFIYYLDKNLWSQLNINIQWKSYSSFQSLIYIDMLIEIHLLLQFTFKNVLKGRDF